LTTLESLVTRWALLDEEFPALRSDAESRVVRWQWAGMNSVWHRPEPFFHERNGFKPAKWLRKPPKKPLGTSEYGFDAEDRFAVARDYGAYGQRNEEYFFSTEDGAWSALFRVHPPDAHYQTEAEADKIAVCQALWRDGRIQRYECYAGAESPSIEVYEYVEDRLVRIEDDFYDPSVPGRAVQTLDISYDARGELESIVERRDGIVLFKRRKETNVRLLKRRPQVPASPAEVETLLRDNGSAPEAAAEIVALLGQRLSPKEMHTWLADPDRSHPVPDPESEEKWSVVLNWTAINAVSAGKTEFVLAEARRFAAGEA
jgi:hypothetical protein